MRLRRTSLLCAACLALLLRAAEAQDGEPPYQGRTVSQWLERLKDPDALVRREAAFALGEIGMGAKGAVPALGGALKDPDVRVRRSAADALGEIGVAAKAGVPALIDALKDVRNPPDVLGAAAWALGEMGPEARSAVPALIDALKGSNDRLRKEAAAALQKIDPEAARKAGLP
jgi:HEAT repeat protein